MFHTLFTDTLSLKVYKTKLNVWKKKQFKYKTCLLDPKCFVLEKFTVK